MKYGVRCRGFHYEGGKEVWNYCWLTANGGASVEARDAMAFKDVGDAWDYVKALGDVRDYWVEVLDK